MGTKKRFYIAKIEGDFERKRHLIDEKSSIEEKNFTRESFVSPVTGNKVKDIATYPYIKYDNKGSQYEGLRDKRKLTDQELKDLYGTRYYEFKQIQGIRETSESRKHIDLNQEPSKRQIPDYLRREDSSRIKDRDVEDYSPEPYKEPYIEEEIADEDLGKLRDLPTIDEEYDFFAKATYSKSGSRDRNVHFVPPKKIEEDSYTQQQNLRHYLLM